MYILTTLEFPTHYFDIHQSVHLLSYCPCDCYPLQSEPRRRHWHSLQTHDNQADHKQHRRLHLVEPRDATSPVSHQGCPLSLRRTKLRRDAWLVDPQQGRDRPGQQGGRGRAGPPHPERRMASAERKAGEERVRLRRRFLPWHHHALAHQTPTAVLWAQLNNPLRAHCLAVVHLVLPSVGSRRKGVFGDHSFAGEFRLHVDCVKLLAPDLRRGSDHCRLLPQHYRRDRAVSTGDVFHGENLR